MPLPPPPNPPSAFASALTGLLGRLGIGQAPPVAYSRFTHLPVYQDSGASWPTAMQGTYSNGAIRLRDSVLQDPVTSGQFVSHEAAHDIFKRANLAPAAPDLVAHGPGEAAASHIYNNPALYPNPNQDHEMLANEGLAYSLGWPSGTPYVQYVASQIKDPLLAQQLLRMHQSRIEANLYRDPSVPPTRIVGRKGKSPLVNP